MLKLKMMSRDDVAGHRQLHVKQSVSQCVKPPPPPALDNAASPTGEPLNGIISASEG